MRYAFSFCALFAAVLPAAETGKPSVTFTKDVAPILFHRCAGCHREGEVAPMSLLSYKDARPWAKSIKEAVLKHAMPPWLADPSYVHSRRGFVGSIKKGVVPPIAHHRRRIDLLVPAFRVMNVTTERSGETNEHIHHRI